MPIYAYASKNLVTNRFRQQLSQKKKEVEDLSGAVRAQPKRTTLTLTHSVLILHHCTVHRCTRSAGEGEVEIVD